MKVFGCKSSGVTSVHSQDGQVLSTSYKEKPDQWREHFASLLKFLSSIFIKTLNEVFQPTQPRPAGSKTAQVLYLQECPVHIPEKSSKELVLLLVREHHLAWQRHGCLQASRTSRWLLRRSAMQGVNYKKSRAHALGNGVFVCFLQEKETSTFAGIVVIWVEV